MIDYKGVHLSYQYDNDDYLQDVLPIPQMMMEVILDGLVVSDVSPFTGLIHIKTGEYLPKMNNGGHAVLPQRYNSEYVFPFTDVLEDNWVGHSISRSTTNKLRVYNMTTVELLNTYGNIE